MKSQKSWLVAIVVIIVLVGLWFVFSGSNGTSSTPGTSSNTQTGRVVFAVKDAATSVVSATSIMITVDKVEAQNATQGWVTASTTSKQYDLLKLKASGAVELLTDANLAVGTYNQIRLNISRVDVTAGGKTQQAKLPSNTLKIVGKVVVTAGTTTTVTLDFIADKSLHITGDGQYIFAPVVKLESKSDAVVQIGSDNKVVISGGNIDADETVGMDERGDLKVGFELKGDFSIGNDGVISVGGNNRELVVILKSENNSGISGKATFEEEDGKVKIKLELNSNILGLLTQTEPAHIHVGGCPGVGAVKYPLNSVINGKSETTINATLAELKAQLPLAVNVHKSVAEVSTYVACGEINL